MPSQKQAKHTHRLKRHKYKSGNIIYFCKLPDCSFKIAPALALGKRVLCNRCGEPFIMNEYSIRLAEPHCEDCHRVKVSLPPLPELGVKYDKIEDLAAGLANEAPEQSLSERLKRVVNHTQLDMSDDGEDEL